MSPEYGATCGFFPVDEATLSYLRLTGRPPERIALVEAYCKENLLWHKPGDHPEYSQVIELDLGNVEPSLAGPRRPQDRVPLAAEKESFPQALGRCGVEPDEDGAVAETFPASDATTEQAPAGEPVHEHAGVAVAAPPKPRHVRVSVEGEEFVLEHGAVVIA